MLKSTPQNSEVKTLWTTWKIYFTRSLRPFARYWYTLTDVEVISEQLMATKGQKADQFSRQEEVQEWVQLEGIRCVFHIPYYHKKNVVRKRANYLLKKRLKPHMTQKDTWLSRVLCQLNIWYGPTKYSLRNLNQVFHLPLKGIIL